MPPTTLQQALGGAQLDIGKLFGVGGSAWAVSGTSGDDDGPAEEVAFGQVTGYARRIQTRRPSPVGVGYVTDTDWIWVGPLTAQTVLEAAQAEHRIYTLTSVADAAYTFQVQTPLDTQRGICALRGLERV